MSPAHPSFKTPSSATAHRMLATHSSRLEVIFALDPEEQFLSPYLLLSAGTHSIELCAVPSVPQ